MSQRGDEGEADADDVDGSLIASGEPVAGLPEKDRTSGNGGGAGRGRHPAHMVISREPLLSAPMCASTQVPARRRRTTTLRQDRATRGTAEPWTCLLLGESVSHLRNYSRPECGWTGWAVQGCLDQRGERRRATRDVHTTTAGRYSQVVGPRGRWPSADTIPLHARRFANMVVQLITTGLHGSSP